MPKLETFALGDEVRDKLTGFQGVICAIYEPIDSAKRYAVHPRTLKDNQLQKGIYLDGVSLKLVKAGALKPTKPAKPTLKLGDKVTDKITGFAGVLTGVTHSHNGCRLWHVTREKLLKGRQVTEEIMEPRLKLAVAGPKLPAPSKGAPPSYEPIDR